MSTTTSTHATAADKTQQVQEQLQRMLSRSATDADFRRRLLTNPREAVAEFSGREVPESYNVVFIENKASATIVLPAPLVVSTELGEDQLEAVAGGSEPVTVTTAAVIGAIAAGIGAAVAIHNFFCDEH